MDCLVRAVNLAVPTGALGDTVDVHRAGAALGNAAAEFRPLETEFVPDHPEQGRIRGALAFDVFAVECELDHGVKRSTDALHNYYRHLVASCLAAVS